jgi:transposase-like protein
MVRRRPRGKTVLRCPQCGSDRILFSSGMITGQVYHCLACDYVGSLVLETDVPAGGDAALR